MGKPLGLYKRRGSPNWFIKFEHVGVQYRRSTRTPDLIEAQRVRDNYMRQVRVSFGLPSAVNASWEDRCRIALDDRKSWLHRIKAATGRRNWSKFRIRHAMPVEALYQVARRTNGLCEVTSLPFVFVGDQPADGPFAISIDRPEPGKPYGPLNCRFVLRGVNYAMNNWGEDAFWRIANAAVGQRLILQDSGQDPDHV